MLAIILLAVALILAVLVLLGVASRVDLTALAVVLVCVALLAERLG